MTKRCDWSEHSLARLRERVATEMSAYRFAHTCGVEQMAARLAALYCPEQALLLRAAALLHDVTKEYGDGQQLALMEQEGIVLRPDERASNKIWHGITAPIVIGREYPEFAALELLAAVRWHTTGREGMTLLEALLYLADYIEQGRTFPDCVLLRERFFGANPERMGAEERLAHLRDVLLLSFEITLRDLEGEGRSVCLDTKAAYEYLKTRGL